MFPQNTPHAQYPTSTPVQRPQSSSDTLRSNYYANIQAVGSNGGGTNMPPPGTMLSPTYGNTQAASMQLALNTSFDSTQMQTPPPTRGTSARKPQQDQQIAFGTPSTIASRRFMTPQHAAVLHSNAPAAQQTPMQYPQLQFSPDMYNFANPGPASAPVASQSTFLWAQAGSPMQPVPGNSLEDPFAPARFDAGWSMEGSQHSNAQAMSFDTPAMNSFPVQAPHPRPASATVAPGSNPLSSMANHASMGVDPSLLYSSPIRPIVRSNSRTNMRHAEDASIGRSASATHQRSDTLLSNTTTSSQLSSSLQRSNTAGTARPKSMYTSMSATEAISRSGSFNHVTRTASPVKRLGRPPLGSISEGKPRHRASVILTIDENGRARTETTRAEESPTRSIRERYPALFDSDSSDEDSDGSDKTPSRPSSFIFDKRDERRAKAARLDPPVENLEGLSIPRSSSAASMKKGVPPSRAAVAAAAQLRRQGSLRRSTSSRNSNRRSVTTTSIDTCPMDFSACSQQAGGANEDSQQSGFGPGWAAHTESFEVPSSRAESTLEAHNRRWSIMNSKDHFQVASNIIRCVRLRKAR
ncbi:uncharacterized protein LTR77_009672 [Saxophila tyrrhenica]|uniref:Uncharacterized protein n=1 Tax=Saxophila tyrrhenica TaxID=1690608 RepID=A0AAV9NWY3_9PEZI|nr:hypothetical protein LTR77_009672 [Saxophila tyrrhenica]